MKTKVASFICLLLLACCAGVLRAQTATEEFCSSQAVQDGTLVDADQKLLAAQCSTPSSVVSSGGRKLLSACSTAAWPGNAFAYGTSVSDTTLFRNDDLTGAPVTLPSPMQFYGSPASKFYPNNNGILTFDAPLSTYTPRAFPLQGSGVPRMIAPYWADVDTRPSDGGEVYYRVATSSTRPADITQAANVVHSTFAGTSVLGNPDYVIVMTWNNVGYFSYHTDLRDSFQVMVAKFGDHTYSCFFYRCMEWTTGDASYGHNGFADPGYNTAAQVGFDSGDNVHFYSAPGSLTNSILNYVNANRQLCFEIDSNPLPAIEARCPVATDCTGLSGNAADRCGRCKSDPCRGCMKLASTLRNIDQNAYNNMPDRCLQSGTNVYALNCLCDIASASSKLGAVRSYTTNFLDRCTRCPDPGSQDKCAKCIFCEFCSANAANQWNQNTIENCVTNANPLGVCGTPYSVATCT